MQILNRQDDLNCCGSCDKSRDALDAVALLNPDLVTVDIRLQQGDGIELIRDIKRFSPKTKMLVVSQCDELIYAERALKAGALGYVLKEKATDEILKAIRTILEGDLYVSPQISTLALHRLLKPDGANKEGIHSLTNRELQVFQLIGAGLSTKKIAPRLFLSVKTVETHRENIKHKLCLANSVELVRHATEWLNRQNSAVSYPNPAASCSPVTTNAQAMA